MDFTRQPMIQTVISPKEGYKLLIRNCKHPSTEEYMVNAIEIVSFGTSLFYRAIEKPKAFLLPVSDYEVIEAKETKMAIKHISTDKTIKISDSSDKDSDSKNNRKKKHPKKKRPNRNEKYTNSEERAPVKTEEIIDRAASNEGGGKIDETEVSSSVVPHVFPTPPAPLTGKRFTPEESEDIPQTDVLPDALEAEGKKPQKRSRRPRKDHSHKKEAVVESSVEAPVEAPVEAVTESKENSEDVS